MSRLYWRIQLPGKAGSGLIWSTQSKSGFVRKFLPVCPLRHGIVTVQSELIFGPSSSLGSPRGCTYTSWRCGWQGFLACNYPRFFVIPHSCRL